MGNLALCHLIRAPQLFGAGALLFSDEDPDPQVNEVLGAETTNGKSQREDVTKSG